MIRNGALGAQPDGVLSTRLLGIQLEQLLPKLLNGDRANIGGRLQRSP
jgi:hypothetical protein